MGLAIMRGYRTAPRGTRWPATDAQYNGDVRWACGEPGTCMAVTSAREMI